MVTSTLTDKGQTTTPQDIREAMGALPCQRLVGGLQIWFGRRAHDAGWYPRKIRRPGKRRVGRPPERELSEHPGQNSDGRASPKCRMSRSDPIGFPTKGGKKAVTGVEVVKNFGRGAVLEKMATFYKGMSARFGNQYPKIKEAADDFFNQHPHLK